MNSKLYENITHTRLHILRLEEEIHLQGLWMVSPVIKKYYMRQAVSGREQLSHC